MGAYLLLYMGVFSYYFRYDQKWHFVIGCILFIFAGAIVYTYSRSALLGLFVSIFFIVIFSARRLLRLYPKQSISLFVVGILAV